MARTAKYKTCDDLINNCEIKDNCFIWPHNENSQASPVISPYAPMTKAMLTNSVARILFTAIRHIPVHGRLVKWCNSPHCVNPYHYSEHRYTIAKRIQTGAVSSLLPDQEANRHLYPSDEDIQAIKPRDPDVMEMLIRQASINPYDSKNLPADIRAVKIVPDSIKPHTFTPVLQMRGVTNELVSKKTEVEDTEVDDLFNGSIFKAIEERKRRLLSKTADDWDTNPK